MSSPGSREAILTAQVNIEQHLQDYSRQESNEPGEGSGKTPHRSDAVSNTQGL
jgi:hypothetical protein